MNLLAEWRARLPTGERLYSIMAAGFIGIILIGCAVFVTSSIMPQTKAWNALAAELRSAQKAVREAQSAQASSPDAIGHEIATAEAVLNRASSVFFSEKQAEEVAKKLYEYAAGNGVDIVSLQGQPGQKGVAQIYSTRVFAVQATGPLPRLMGFIAQIKEARLLGFTLANLSISSTKKAGLYSLSMQVILYTSSGAPQTPLPAATTLATRTAEGTRPLETALATAWDGEKWPEVIALIEQILALDPGRSDMEEKLYGAHVNYGYELYRQGDTAGAVAEFQAALLLRSSGQEAQAGLRTVNATPTPMPTATPMPVPTATPRPQPTATATPRPRYVLYTVQPKDTLYSLAKRFNTTPQAIMAANGLSDFQILAGNQLRIPVP